MIKQLFFSFLFIQLPILSLAQCGMFPVSMEEKTISSTLIVEGHVVEQYSYFQNGLIYTSNKIDVYKVLKGSITKDYIYILTEGGVVGDKAEATSNLLWVEPDDYGVFMCKQMPKETDLFDVYASAQGFLRFNEDYSAATDIFHIYNDIEKEIYQYVEFQIGQKYQLIRGSITPVYRGKLSSAPSITSLNPKTIAGGMNQVLTITGSGFGSSRGTNYVLFPNVDDGGNSGIKPASVQYISWSNTEIKVEVPYKAGSGNIKVVVSASPQAVSTEKIIVPYSQINVDLNYPTRARHSDASGSGGYRWIMNSSFKDSTLARISFEKQFSKWRCATGASWHISSATTSIDSSGVKTDGVNIITYDILPAGVLGVCRSYYAGCTDKTWYVSELDISFSKETSTIKWHYDESSPITNQYDFGSVVLHELGHGMQLAHSADSAALMFYALKKNQIKPSIDDNALAGVKKILDFDKSDGSCGPAPMLIIGTENCSNPYYAPQYISSISSTPNPCTSDTKVHFSLEKSGLISIDLYDHKGNFIANISQKQLGVGLHEIPITFESIYPAGMYFIRVVKGDEVISTGKIIKQ